MKYIIERHIEDISINSKETRVNDDGTVALFDSVKEAEQYLLDHGFSLEGKGIVAVNPALAAIQYALDGDNHEHDADNQLRFLELWNEGEFQTIRDNWDSIPDEVFIGADTQFKLK